LSSFEVGAASYSAIVKLDEGRVAVISGDKKVVILEHSKRRNIKQVGDITTKDVGEGIADMHGYGDNIVVVGKNGSCQTLNPVTAKRRRPGQNLRALHCLLSRKLWDHRYIRKGERETGCFGIGGKVFRFERKGIG